MNAQNEFLRDVTIKLVSKADLYAGKICATLNRQHPRDLFDIKMLLDTDGLTEKICKAFVCHVACDSRPISELINPNMLDITDIFEKEFQGITRVPTSLSELLDVRLRLIRLISSELTTSERKFLLSIKQKEPDWSLIDTDVQHLPAIHWRLMNLRKMKKDKHAAAVEKLKRVLKL